jgi:2-hydroxychromene-2-carboxylate isomerase
VATAARYLGLNVLAECLARAGTDPDLARRAATSEAREALAEDTRRAYANGIFGVPTFVCNDELFFGNDRLDMLAWRLGSGGLAQRNPPVSLP